MLSKNAKVYTIRYISAGGVRERCTTVKRRMTWNCLSRKTKCYTMVSIHASIRRSRSVFFLGIYASVRKRGIR